MTTSTVPLASPADQLTEGVDGSTTRRGGWTALAVLLALVVGSQLAGLLGVPFTDTDRGSWYDALDKPSFNPPGAVFAPVWTTLYLAMAVAAWLVWRHPDSARRRIALQLFAVQLALNALWSPLFFGAEQTGWALAEIVLLLAAVATTLVLFLRVDRVAGLLLVPYLAWVAFATVLNASIVSLK
jgi:tryptophan-rich sensory protein